MAHNYDAIIIGSGIGGLTCAAFLARHGLRVLVLEQHSKIGGYAHSFQRKKFTFESGVHCMPLAAHGVVRHLLRLLDVESLITPVELPAMYRATTPGFSCAMPSNKDELASLLQSRFPLEKENIRRLLDDMTHFYDILEKPVLDFEDNFKAEDADFVSRFHNRSYQSYVNGFVQDPLLRFLVGAIWPYGGTAPELAPTVFYVIMYIIHTIEGSHTLAGGFGTLADALARAIVRRGGEIRTRSRVTGIRTEAGRAAAVLCADGSEQTARLFVSNVSPYLLHSQLLPEQSRSKRWLRRLSNLRPAVSSVSVYLGMKPAFANLVPDNITFWFAHTDASRIYKNIITNNRDGVDHLVLLRTMERADFPTLTLMNFARESASSNWREDKRRIAREMIDKAEVLFPGLGSCVELMEIGSPATFERYTANTGGSLYGFESTCEMYGEAKMPLTTHIENLFQVGHWCKPGGGIHNVMVNAYTAYHLMKRAQAL